MRHGKLSNLVVVSKKEGDGKMTAEEYCDLIMDGEMFDFWLEGIEEFGCMVMMEDSARYYKAGASMRRKQLE